MTFFYKKLLILSCVALFASHLVASIGVEGTTLDVINLKGYPYALFMGAAIALFILYSLPAVTTELNPRFLWKNNWVVRLGFQLLFGIVVPFMIVMFH